MTYCVGVIIDTGMIFASDSRTNAGMDNFAKFCKMTVFERRGNRVIVLLSSGNLAGTQAVISVLTQRCADGDAATNLMGARTMFDVVRLVSDAMRDPLVGSFARRLMTEDLRSTVAAPAGYDVLAYCDQLLRRFENPSLAHRTQQIAMDGTQKVAVRWLPALRTAADAEPIEHRRAAVLSLIHIRRCRRLVE